MIVELLCTLWRNLRGLVEDSHEIGHSLLVCYRKQNSRDRREGHGLHQGLGGILVCQAGGRLSSSTVIGNVVRKDVSSNS